MYQVNDDIPLGCVYEKDGNTKYCPMLNHEDVPFCQYFEDEPEAAIGIDERPVYCPISDVPEPCENAISKQAAIDALCDNCNNPQAVCAHYPCKQYTAIETLPSVQPELNTQLYTDGFNDGYAQCKEDNAQWVPKKGKWIETDKHDIYYQPGYKCSVCGILTTCHGDYCPNCGADMRGRQYKMYAPKGESYG